MERFLARSSPWRGFMEVDTIKHSLALIAILALLIVGCSAPRQQTQQQNTQQATPLKLAFIGPLSGSNAFYGKFSKEGIDLAVADINAQGGIDGRQVEIAYD